MIFSIFSPAKLVEATRNLAQTTVHFCQKNKASIALLTMAYMVFSVSASEEKKRFTNEAFEYLTKVIFNCGVKGFSVDLISNDEFFRNLDLRNNPGTQLFCDALGIKFDLAHHDNSPVEHVQNMLCGMVDGTLECHPPCSSRIGL